MGRYCSRSEPGITVNCVCPGLVQTNIMPKAISDATPEEHLTLASTVIGAIMTFIEDDSLTAKVAECSGKNVYYVPPKDWADDTTKYIYSGASWQNADRGLLMKQVVEMKAALAKNLGEEVSSTSNGDRSLSDVMKNI